MPDIMSKDDRSKRMSLIRSRWTKPEKWFHNYLKGYKIRHVMHPKIKGSPDIIIPEKNLAIFIHGCFWHGCKNCYRKPVNNKRFWEDKITRNIERDKKNNRKLKKEGWKIKTIWECGIPRRNPRGSIIKIIKKLS